MNLKGKVVLLVGGSGGIGAPLTRLLAQHGATVVAAARSVRQLQDLAAGVTTKGGAAHAIEVDVTSEQSVEDLVNNTRRAVGPVDVVINNAGSGGDLTSWGDYNASEFRTMFEVHLFGMERVVRRVLPEMIARGEGRVVNVASMVGWVPMPYAIGYSAAKAAVVSFTASLREQMKGTGVDVTLVVPPHTRTASSERWPIEGSPMFDPEWVAKKIVVGLIRDRATIMPGWTNSLMMLMHRTVPSTALRINSTMGSQALARAR